MLKNKHSISTILILLFLSCNTEPNIKKEYYPNGQLKFIKRYQDGILNGQAQWFYDNGNIEQTVIFKQGEENGNAYYFYTDGALKNFRYWRDGKMVSYVTDYYDDSVGIIKNVLLYNNDGQLIYRKHFDSLGNFLKEEGKKPGW